MKKKGKMPKKRKKRRRQVYLSDSIWEKLAKNKEKTGISISLSLELGAKLLLKKLRKKGGII